MIEEGSFGFPAGYRRMASEVMSGLVQYSSPLLRMILGSLTFPSGTSSAHSTQHVVEIARHPLGLVHHRERPGGAVVGLFDDWTPLHFPPLGAWIGARGPAPALPSPLTGSPIIQAIMKIRCPYPIPGRSFHRTASR